MLSNERAPAFEQAEMVSSERAVAVAQAEMLSNEEAGAVGRTESLSNGSLAKAIRCVNYEVRKLKERAASNGSAEELKICSA
jgi:hypothetical protein